MKGVIEQLKRVHILENIPEAIDFGGSDAGRRSVMIGPAAVVMAFALAAGASIYFDPSEIFSHQAALQATPVLPNAKEIGGFCPGDIPQQNSAPSLRPH